MKKLIVLLAVVLSAACAPETKTKRVDVPDTAILALPALGFTAQFTYTYSDSNGEEEEVVDPVAFNCFFKKGTSGQNVDVCGFTTRVSEDAYSFDTDKYLSVSWFATYLLAVGGSGDLNAATINIAGEDANSSDFEYDLDYEITITGELLLPEGTSFAEAQISTLNLPVDADSFVDRQTGKLREKRFFEATSR